MKFDYNNLHFTFWPLMCYSITVLFIKLIKNCSTKLRFNSSTVAGSKLKMGGEKIDDDQVNTDDEEEEEEEYVVEKILKHKLNKNNEILYFLKWKGYPLEDNTWEPASNLNCPELIEQYEKECKEKKRKSYSRVTDNEQKEHKLTEKPVPDEKKKQTKRKQSDEG